MPNSKGHMMKAPPAEPDIVYTEVGFSESGPPMLKAQIRVDCPPDELLIAELVENIRAAIERNRKMGKS